MPKKRYKLKCFNCGYSFQNREDVCRVRGMPYCGVCEGDHHEGIAMTIEDNYYEEKWAQEHPGVDREQYEIDRAHIRKYGEY